MNDEHLFTHDEQEEVKAMLREILDNTTVNKLQAYENGAWANII